MGSSASTNSSEMTQTIETRSENSNASSFASSHEQSISIVASSDTGDATVEMVGGEITQSLETALTGSMKAVMDNSVQTDLSQISSQLAKSTTSGFNPLNFSSSNNSVRQSQKVTQTIINSISTSCEQSATQSIDIAASSRTGNAKVRLQDVPIRQIGTSMANCVGDVVMKNTTKTAMTQSSTQSAISETKGLNLDAMCLVACAIFALVGLVGLVIAFKMMVCNLDVVGALLVVGGLMSAAVSGALLPGANKDVDAATSAKADVESGRSIMKETFLTAPSQRVIDTLVLDHVPKTGGAMLRAAASTQIDAASDALDSVHARVASVTTPCVLVRGVRASDAMAVFASSPGKWVAMIWMRSWDGHDSEQTSESPSVAPSGALAMWDESLFPRETVTALPAEFTYRGYRIGRLVPMWEDNGGRSQRMPPPRLVEQALTITRGRPQQLPTCAAPSAPTLATSVTVPATAFKDMFAIHATGAASVEKRKAIVHSSSRRLGTISIGGAMSADMRDIFGAAQGGTGSMAPSCVSKEGWLREWDSLSVVDGRLSIRSQSCVEFLRDVYSASDSSTVGDVVLGIEVDGEGGSKMLKPALLCGHESSRNKSGQAFPQIDSDSMSPDNIPSLFGVRAIGSARVLERAFKGGPPQRHTETGRDTKGGTLESDEKMYLISDYGIEPTSPASEESEKALQLAKNKRMAILTALLGSVATVIIGITIFIIYFVKFRSSCKAAGSKNATFAEMMAKVPVRPAA